MRGAAIVAALLVGAAGPPAAFEYSPQPRWAEDPDTDVVCEAIRKECPAVLKDGQIDTDWDYAEIYNPDGMLVGVRSLSSTGCKPLEEHLVLGQRHFRTLFTKPGQSDLDDIKVELKAGTPKDAVRMVKTGSTRVSIGC
jgi:hypothetical protein